MRIVPSRYLQGKPLTIKPVVSKIAHLSAPLKGLSLSSKLTEGDPLTAPVLDNWVVEEMQIRVRPGSKLEITLPDENPVQTIIPHYAPIDTMALAAGGFIYAENTTVLGSGFGNNDWSWTTFSNLGDQDYTVLANGSDGVWSWNGDDEVSETVTVTKISDGNPAQVTVGAADIGKFHNGDRVRINGADATHDAANGWHTISSVGTPANTFTLVGVDTSASTGDQTTGTMNAISQGSLFKEDVKKPAAETWVDVEQIDTVLSHMNRLFFADSKNLAIYYLPVEQKAGELKLLPLNSVFRRGGKIAAMYTWTLDGGAGMDDQLVIFSDHGECVIYSGTDPDTDFSLVGIFRFDSPMSKQSVINFGGDLYVMTSTGLYALTKLIRAESERAGPMADKNVFSAFWERARLFRDSPGWGVLLEHHTGMAICNLPSGGGRYVQMVRFMPNPIWASWSNLDAWSWQWLHDRIYYGDARGRVFSISKDHLSDNGQPIIADLQLSWSSYKTPALKHWKMLLPYVITDGVPRPYLDVQVDYDTALPRNQPDVTTGNIGAEWDVATWDEDYWAQSPRQRGQWQGVARLGRVGAPRMRVSIIDCTFALAGMDVIYEPGSAV